MKKNTKVNAAILIIGNEILSGRTQDTNTSTLAVWLNSIGVQVNEVRVIPDTKKTIIENLNILRKNNDYVFTTGGIGPTHDDITAESVSEAFGLKYEIHPEAFKILESYYKPGDFNEGRQKMDPILSHTISLRTVESEIANSLSKVQDQNKDVEIGSYPFFHAGKLGVSIVLRSEQQSKIDDCSAQILNFIKEKKIEIVDR